MKKKLEMSILYVEDETSIREEISYFLSKITDTLHVAQNGQEGFNLYEKHNPDLLITDISMPILDGISMSKAIRGLNPDSKIIMLTAYSDTESLLEVINLGVDGYLVKPIDLSLLYKNIKKIFDLTNLKKENKKVINLFEQYKSAVDLSTIVSKADAKGNITYVNKKFEKISGYTKEELIGHPHSIVRHEDMSSETFQNLWETIQVDKKPWFGQIKNKRKDGSAYFVDTVINPILDTNGDIVEYIGIRHDITDVMNPKKQLLNDLDSFDNPTLILGKINNYSILKEFYTEDERTKFEDYFSKILLDFFPSHLAIEKIYILGNGLYGFINNESFNSEHIKIYLSKVLKKLRLSDIIFEDNKYEIDVSFSYANDKTHIYDDALIGIGKLKDSKEYILYSNGLYNESQAQARKKLKTLALIKNSLKEEDRVISYYQPIICNDSKDIVKYESLIRMITDKEQVLTPYHFMEVAKKTGYYHELTHKVIENASKILRINKEIKISINLSSTDIEDLKTRDLLFALASEESNKSRVTFELLEDESVKDLIEIKNFIQLVKLIGDVKISIDDFGSGYSNYERLSVFQPDFIKIDGSLIKDILTNKYNESVVKSIVLFAKENQIKTIAEFVSSEEIYKKVKSLGIDYSQGFYFGKPEPIMM